MSLSLRMMPRTLGVLRTSRRWAVVPGVTMELPTNEGKTPPTLEEFDPLHPGEWQLGAGGKILPRLPIGTKCGKLVMGEYGLYDPRLRKQVELYQKGIDEGKVNEDARPFDRRLSVIGKILGVCCLVVSFWNCASFIHGHPLWPYHNLKPPGST